MSFSALGEFRFNERAELLAAVFGDGSIEKRGHKGHKISVGVSDTWPLWHARVPELFGLVFGRVFERRKKTSPAGVTYYEYHVTSHDPLAVLGVSEKYDTDGRIVPPKWIESDPEFIRRFILGLVETDGCFSIDKEDGTPSFTFSQSNDYLSAWFTETLCKLGYPCYMSYGVAAEANQPRISQTEATARFGEWLQSEKWLALKEGGFAQRSMVVDRKRRGVPARARQRHVLKSVDLTEQERWREWRRQGASILAISRHVGRSNNVVYAATGDIVPTTTKTAEELGLKPLPRLPKEKRFSALVVAEWRERGMAGESSRTIAAEAGIRQGIVDDALADIRWDQLMAKRELHQAKLVRMKQEAQGNGRWSEQMQTLSKLP